MPRRRNIRVHPPTKRVWRPARASRRRQWLRYPLPQYGAGLYKRRSRPRVVW